MTYEKRIELIRSNPEKVFSDIRYCSNCLSLLAFIINARLNGEKPSVSVSSDFSQFTDEWLLKYIYEHLDSVVDFLYALTVPDNSDNVE